MAVTSRPAFIPLPEVTAFPPALLALPNWVAYDLEERKGEWTKIPINPRTGGRGKSNDPTTWGTFAVARAHAARKGLGVGFMLAPPFFGFDLDDCIIAGEITPLATSVLGELDTYAETSVSGTGIKGIGIGEKPGTRCRRKGLKLEIYDSARLFALTGRRLPGAPLALNDCQEGLDFIHGVAFGRDEPAAVSSGLLPVIADDDRAAVDWLREHRPNFARLWDGPHGEDASADDLALCNLLAWRVADPARVDRLFRQSGLMRPKWDERRGAGTYGERTVTKAFTGRTSFYAPRPASPARRLAPPPPVDRVQDATIPQPLADPALAAYLALSHEELARVAYDAERAARAAQRSLANFIQLRRNPAIKAERDTLAAVAVDLMARVRAGEADAEGYIRQPASRIADAAGKSAQVVRTHRRRGEEWGLWDSKIVEERDPETGARRTATYVRPKDEPEKILDILVTLDPPREAKGWGGKREPCPRCGSTATRTVTHCADCDLVLKETHRDGDEEDVPTDEPITPADLRAEALLDEPAADAPSVLPTPVEDLAAYPLPAAEAEPKRFGSDRAAYLAERDADAADADLDTWDPYECNAPGCTRRLNPDLGKRFCWEHRRDGLAPTPRPLVLRAGGPGPEPGPEPPTLDADLVADFARRHDAATIAEKLGGFQHRWDAGERGEALLGLIADWRAIAASRAALDNAEEE